MMLNCTARDNPRNMLIGAETSFVGCRDTVQFTDDRGNGSILLLT